MCSKMTDSKVRDFYNACTYGDLETVKSLLRKGEFDWQIPSPFKRYDLDIGTYFADSNGHREVVQYVVSQGGRYHAPSLEFYKNN